VRQLRDSRAQPHRGQFHRFNLDFHASVNPDMTTPDVRVPKADRTLIALRLGRIAGGDSKRQLEMRASTDERFHDHYLLREDGSLDLIGHQSIASIRE
jgi:hypothetical protein